MSSDSASCLARWLRIADHEEGNNPAPVKQLEQEVEMLCRAIAYFARDSLSK